LNVNEIKSLDTPELYDFLSHYDYSKKQEWESSTKFSFFFRVHNQRDLLRVAINTVESVATEIIILDDCSTDGSPEMARDEFGAKIVYLPEGWLYTFGTAKGYELSHRLSSSKYSFQVDADERLYFPREVEELNQDVDIFTVIRLNEHFLQHNFELYTLQYDTPLQLFQESTPRVSNTEKLPLWHGIVHPQIVNNNYKIEPLPVYLMHFRDRVFSRDHWLRRERLYSKLLKKGYEEKTGSPFGIACYNNYRDFYNKRISLCEKEIGILEETKDRPAFVGWNEQELDTIKQMYTDNFERVLNDQK